MDRIEYQKQQQLARYRYKKQQRMKKRRRRTAAFIMILLNIVVIAAIAFFVNQFILADKSGDDTTDQANPGIVQTTNEADKGNKELKKEKAKDTSEPKNTDYASHYCYKKANQSRYEAYHAKNPHLSIDEVVWQVEAYLDYPFYGHDVPVADITDPLVIVNKYHKVDESQKPELVTADGYLMTPATAEAYKKMKNDAASRGLAIAAASTYRSVPYQRDLYNSYLNRDPRETVDTYSARAGYSEHHTGMAIDFIGSFGSLNDFENTPEYPWVRDNCHKYGFVIRYTTENQWITGYKNEPWHLRYLGVEIATDMKNKGVSSYEEYKVKYIDNRP